MLKHHYYEKAIQWASTYFSSHGYKLKNTLPEEIQVTPWSYVVRFITHEGYIYLKQMPKQIALEPLIIQTLSHQFHAPVPQIIAHNKKLHCFLMKDAGKTLRDILKKQFDEALLCKAIDKFTVLQLAASNHIDLLLNIGVPDWRLDKLPALFERLLLQRKLLIADGLTLEKIDKLIALHPKVSYLCKKLDDYSILPTIVQPDFNDNNTLIDNKSPNITFIDLGEIVISHPFFSLLNCLQQIKKHHGLKDSDSSFLRIKEACFKNYIPKTDLEEVLAIANVVWVMYDALSQYRLMLACGIEKIMAVQRGRLSNLLETML